MKHSAPFLPGRAETTTTASRAPRLQTTYRCRAALEITLLLLAAPPISPATRACLVIPGFWLPSTRAITSHTKLGVELAGI